MGRFKECPLSCGVCEGVKCADTNSTQCKIWADAGECLNNPLAVMKECPDSCGVGPLPCSAAYPLWSPDWRNFRATGLGPHQDVRCAPPQVCSTVCMDHDESCAGWAKDSQCDDNKAFMFRVCPSSCGVCQMLENKDEL